MTTAGARVRDFCGRHGLDVPILLAPMPGACPPELSIAVASAGGLGACGALLMTPKAIADWIAVFRAHTNGGFLINTWIPDPEPARDAEHEARVRDFLGRFGPTVAASAGDARPVDFAAQCAAMVAASPRVMTSIMGLYPPDTVAAMKARAIAWFATVTTVAEARAAVAAGADAVIAQGSEAGGHRGAFMAAMA
ncbi:MAG: nitronate monooxygenase, partial [Alphaproteobacteria bacterium]